MPTQYDEMPQRAFGIWLLAINVNSLTGLCRLFGGYDRPLQVVVQVVVLVLDLKDDS